MTFNCGNVKIHEAIHPLCEDNKIWSYSQMRILPRTATCHERSLVHTSSLVHPRSLDPVISYHSGHFRPNELIFFSSLKHRYWNTCCELCFIIEGWKVSRGVSCDLLVYVIYDRSSAVRPEMQFSRLVPSLGAYIPIETDRITFRFLIFPTHYLFLPTNRCVRPWGRTSWSSLPLPPTLLLIGK